MVTKFSKPEVKLRCSLTTSQKQLIKLGWATAEYIAKTPEERQARVKAIEIAMEKAKEAKKAWLRADLQQYNDPNWKKLDNAKRELRHAKAVFKYTRLCDKTITINKENVADIGEPI